MTGFDASSSECYSGPVELQIVLEEGVDPGASELLEEHVRAFLKALTAGFFFPGTLHKLTTDVAWINSTSLYCKLEVVELAKTAFSVLGGLLADCRHHDVLFRSARAILQSDMRNLLIETGLRPDAANRPAFLVEIPEDMSGNYALLVEIEFANPVLADIGQHLLDDLALWEVL